jgi:transcription initiation factor TFIID subunit 10
MYLSLEVCFKYFAGTLGMEHVDSTGLPTGLPQLLNCLSENELTIPDELTRYLLRTVGVDMRDERALRMVSLAAQRFIATVLNDAYLLRKQKRDRSRNTTKQLKQMGMSSDEPSILTKEDVSNVLDDAGVHIQQQMYYMNGTRES